MNRLRLFHRESISLSLFTILLGSILSINEFSVDIDDGIVFTGERSDTCAYDPKD